MSRFRMAVCVMTAGLLMLTSVLSYGQVASLSTNTLNFGNQAVSTSNSKSMRLTNTGTAALTGITVSSALAPFSSSNNCPASLAYRGSCTITVTFSPTALGPANSSISISDNATNSPQTINLTGTGVAQVSLPSAPLSFGNQGLGTSSSKAVNLSNNLKTALALSTVTASGDFAIATAPINPCGSSVPAGSHCSIGVTFTPTQFGPRFGTLTVTDRASNSPQTATLTGTGTAQGVSSIAVTPANATISVGATQPFIATGTFPTGITQDLTKLVFWSSSSATIASISNISGSQGKSIGKAAGTTVIKAALNDKYGSTSLTVSGSSVITPTVAWPTPAAITYGTALGATQLVAIASAGGTTVPGTYVYTPGAGAVLPAGNQTLSVVFTPTDTTHYTTATASVFLTVNKATATVTLSIPATTYDGTAKSVTATINPAGPAVTVTYNGSGTLPINAGSYAVVATVNNANYQGGASGTLVISQASQTITFTTPATAAYNSSFAVSASASSGLAVTIAASGVCTLAGSTVTMTSGTGTCTLTASQAGNSNYSAAANVTNVVTAQLAQPVFSGLVSQTITFGTASVSVSGSIGAGSAFPSGEVVSVSVAGLSASATVASNGGFSAVLNTATVAASTTPNVITYSYAGDSNFASVADKTTSLTVNQPSVTLVSIAITPANSSIPLGGTQAFTATGTYSDHSTAPLTTGVTWSSTAVQVATISSSGLVTPVALGVTTITATDGTVSGSTNLAVTGAANFVLTGPLGSSRDPFTATRLFDGTVLIAGGYDSNQSPLSSAEVYDSAGQASTTITAFMTSARANHTATLLNNGKVLFVGGYSAVCCYTGALANAELYNPKTQTFTLTKGAPSIARAQHTATLLQDGTVLIAGGIDATGNVLASAEIYNPATDQFTVTNSLITARYGHTATLLSDGTVFVAGGATDITPTPTNTAEIYSSGVFSGGLTMHSPRAFQTATLLNDGTVLIAGGVFDTNLDPVNTAELYSNGSFASIVSTMNSPRKLHTATLLNNGMVLIAGGSSDNLGIYGTPTTSADLYDPVAQAFNATGALNTARSQQTATLLVSGAVLIAGGSIDGSGTTTTLAELYQPATFTPAYLQSITVTPATTALPIGSKQQFVATGNFNHNGTLYSQQLAAVTWTSTDTSGGPNVAQVSNDASNSGTALALTVGTAAITAAAGPISTSACRRGC